MTQTTSSIPPPIPAERLGALNATELLREGHRALARRDDARARACIRVLEKRTTRLAHAALEDLRAARVERPGAGAVPRQRGPGDAWFKRARRIAEQFESEGDGDRWVYVILLEFEDSEFGLYVGETCRTPEERFAQHKRGHKASRYARKYGVRVLADIGAHLVNMSQDASKLVESELAEELRAAGYRVEGGH